jgi:hypothetical protein
MSRVVALIVLIGVVLGPSYARAEAETDTLTAQLEAISSYVVRSFGTGQKPLTADELRASVRAGATWLVNAQEQSGHFRYEYIPYKGIYRNDDNIVRQTGALYALGEILRKTNNNLYDVARTTERAVDYIEILTKEDRFEDKEILCITRTVRGMRCPLGATSLALIGILSYVEAISGKDTEYRTLIEGYLSHILASQKENGGFRTDYVIQGDVSEKESPYSNGEALLALVRYYQYEPDPDVKAAIDAAFAHLKTGPHDAALYLWIMAALSDMQKLWPSDAYVTYTKSFTDWRVAGGKQQLTERTRNFCGYSEGLSAALSVLKGHIPVSTYDALKTELDVRNLRHYTLQLRKGDHYRITTETGVTNMSELANETYALGGFLTSDREPTERIDFTQHCITSYMQTLDLMDETLH